VSKPWLLESQNPAVSLSFVPHSPGGHPAP
jgi:hypothetical protein